MATRFFVKSMITSGKPAKVNVDKSGSNTSALQEINKYLPKSEQIEICQCKCLNNIIEQDHHFIKKITKPTLGFKALHSAKATLDGVELHHMLRKAQMKNPSNQAIFEQFFALAA